MTTENTQSTENNQQNQNPVENVEGLKKKNEELLGEVKELKKFKQELLGTFEKIGVKDLNGLQDVFKTKTVETESLKGKTLTLEEQIAQMNSNLDSMKNELNQERESKLLLSVNQEILNALDAEKINAKGKAVLGEVIKNKLNRDGNDFFYKEGDARMSIRDYASKVAKEYPEFQSAQSFGGSGGSGGQNVGVQGKVNELLKSGNTISAIDQMLKQQNL